MALRGYFFIYLFCVLLENTSFIYNKKNKFYSTHLNNATRLNIKVIIEIVAPNIVFKLLHIFLGIGCIYFMLYYYIISDFP